MNQPMLISYGELDTKQFLHLIDFMYDEVLIYDNQYTIAYINHACSRHYGYLPEQMIGRSFFDFVKDNCWDISILPIVYEKQKSYAVKQKTILGSQLLTIAVPIFDSQNKLTHVIMNVRDDVSSVPLYNPNYIYHRTILNPSATPLYDSKIMQEIIRFVQRISQVDVTCILTGESGTGKTMIARYIHSSSPRQSKPFISLNCASIPSELVESELFGYTKGAFTGANVNGKKGLFEEANGGTILLDEVAELPLSAQAKLLHVLQDREYLPVGGSTPIRVDVRIIAATNKNLQNLVTLGQFREDLFYRLNVVEIYLPPLRKHKEDIPCLASKFLKECNLKYHFEKSLDLSALEKLMDYEWKGNVRELQHMIERLAVTIEDNQITALHLPKVVSHQLPLIPPEPKLSLTSFDAQVEQFEAQIIRDAYKKSGSSRKVASYLHLSQTKANRLIQKYIKED